MAPSAVLKLPLLERLARETANQWAYRCLRHAVMIGMVAPGRPITIRDVAGVLGLSTMPVREALRRLSTEQALEEMDNRRIIVPKMTPAKFAALCELRIVLESHAGERAMPYVTSSRLQTLASVDRIIDEAVAAGDRERLITHNLMFHRLIYEADPDQMAMPLIESVWLQLGPFLRLALSRLKDFYEVDRHSEAMDALRRQDAAALRAAIEADVRDGLTHVGTSDLLKAYVERPEGIDDRAA